MKLLIVCLLIPLMSACSSLQPVKSAQSLSPEMDTKHDIPAILPKVEFKAEPQNVWDRITSQFSLDHDIDNQRLRDQLNWYASHSSYMGRVSERGKRYLYYIISQIEERGMPGELALLPVVESAFDPFAYSHGRASGVWQFIPSTGEAYGLKQDWWSDDRRDIRAATNAALTYLDKLQQQFDGDWLLALASYNSGGGTVRRAIRRNREKGLPTDFWSLDLPKETRAYVPKLIALAQLVKNPSAYDLKLPDLPNAPYFDVVETGGQIDLTQIAELSDTQLEEIYRLNPQYNRWATHPEGPHQVLVPIENADTLRQQLSSLPNEQRVHWKRYKVRSGDSLNRIANHHHTTANALMIANDLSNNKIYLGQTLLIPTARHDQNEYSHSLSQRMAKLQSMRKPSSRASKSVYRVRSGDSFWTIARAHNVTVKEITRWNGLAPNDPIQIGQKLVIWGKENSSNREVIRKVNYQVRKGDSLAAIANKFKVSLKDLRSWNVAEVAHKYLHPGQKLTLYVDVTR